MKYNVSIVMPVFNTGAVLRETMDSIFSQNFDSFEVICVDDGSDDKETIAALREYNTVHDNMKIIFGEHQGAAIARNKGMDTAEGEYILFLDSDDLYRYDFLKTMYDEISKTQSDCSICGYYDDYIVFPMNKTKPASESENLLCKFPIAPWTKIYKRSFLIDNNIRFQNLPSSNDVKFYCLSLLLSKKITTVCESGLVWHRTNRAGRISSGRKSKYFLEAVKSLKDELEERHKLTCDFKKKILFFSIEVGKTELKNDNDGKCYTAFREYLNEFDTELTDFTVEQHRVSWLCEPTHEWLYLVGDYRGQLFKNRDTILRVLNDKKNIFVWGYGKRGRAFFDFSSGLNIEIKGVYDKNPISEEIGINMSSFQEMKYEADLVVVTSFLIKNDSRFSELTEIGVDILDLSRYCPL